MAQEAKQMPEGLEAKPEVSAEDLAKQLKTNVEARKKQLQLRQALARLTEKFGQEKTKDLQKQFQHLEERSDAAADSFAAESKKILTAQEIEQGWVLPFADLKKQIEKAGVSWGETKKQVVDDIDAGWDEIEAAIKANKKLSPEELKQAINNVDIPWKKTKQNIVENVDAGWEKIAKDLEKQKQDLDKKKLRDLISKAKVSWKKTTQQVNQDMEKGWQDIEEQIKSEKAKQNIKNQIAKVEVPWKKSQTKISQDVAKGWDDIAADLSANVFEKQEFEIDMSEFDAGPEKSTEFEFEVSEEDVIEEKPLEHEIDVSEFEAEKQEPKEVEVDVEFAVDPERISQLNQKFEKIKKQAQAIEDKKYKNLLLQKNIAVQNALKSLESMQAEDLKKAIEILEQDLNKFENEIQDQINKEIEQIGEVIEKEKPSFDELTQPMNEQLQEIATKIPEIKDGFVKSTIKDQIKTYQDLIKNLQTAQPAEQENAINILQKLIKKFEQQVQEQIDLEKAGYEPTPEVKTEKDFDLIIDVEEQNLNNIEQELLQTADNIEPEIPIEVVEPADFELNIDESAFAPQLKDLRNKYVEARAKLKKYQGISGALRRVFNTEKANLIKLDVQETWEAYDKARAEALAEHTENWINENTKLADAQAEAFNKEFDYGSKLYKCYKKLGEMSLYNRWEKKGKLPKSRIGKMLAKAANVRVLVSAGLLGTGFVAGAAIGAGTAAGVFSFKRLWSAFGSGVGSFDLMKMIADKRRAKKLSDEKIAKMGPAQLAEQLEYYEAVAPLNGKKPTELPLYNKLKQAMLDKLPKTGNEKGIPKELAMKMRENLANDYLEEFNTDVVEIIKLRHLLDSKFIPSKDDDKSKQALQKINNILKAMPKDLRQSFESYFSQQKLQKPDQRLALFVQAEELKQKDPNKIEEDLILSSKFELKPVVLKKLKTMFEKSKDAKTAIDSAARKVYKEVRDNSNKERREAEKKAVTVEKILLKLAKTDIEKVEALRKKDIRNDAIMKTVATGIAAFVGSGGISWLMKKVGFIGEAKGMNPDRANAIGVDSKNPPQGKTAEFDNSKETKASIAKNKAFLDVKNAKGEDLVKAAQGKQIAGLGLKKGEGVLHGVNRIFKQTTEFKDLFKNPSEMRAWKLAQLKQEGWTFENGKWKAPYTVHPGDKIRIIKTKDGKLDLIVERQKTPRVALSAKELRQRIITKAAETGTKNEKDFKNLFKQIDNTYPKDKIDGSGATSFDAFEKALNDRVANEGVLSRTQELQQALVKYERQKLATKELRGLNFDQKQGAPEQVLDSGAKASEVNFRGTYGLGEVVVIKKDGLITGVKIKGSAVLDQTQLIKEKILNKNFIENGKRKMGDVFGLFRNIVIKEGRTVYLYEQALKQANIDKNPKLAAAIRKTMMQHVKGVEKVYGNVFRR